MKILLVLRGMLLLLLPTSTAYSLLLENGRGYAIFINFGGAIKKRGKWADLNKFYVILQN